MSTKPSVLVVDDDPDVREVLVQFLGQRGYHVETAADGLEGMRILKQRTPDVLLLDIEMPSLNGLEVLRRILAADIEVGVIMISGYDDEEACRMALRLGAADFVPKPLDLDYLETSMQAKLLALMSP